MKLQEWAANNNVKPIERHFARGILTTDYTPEVARLDDYQVDGCSGGVYWLRPIWDKHKSQLRMNIRNAYLIATKKELEEQIEYRKDDQFAVDCLNELLSELE